MLVLRAALVFSVVCICAGGTQAEEGAAATHPGAGPGNAVDSANGVSDKAVIRFQAIALPKTGGAIGDRLMIVDTQTGDVWQWWDNVAQKVGRTGITYMGRLKPGHKPGETITYQRFDAQKDNR